MTPPDDKNNSPEMGTVPLSPDELKTNVGTGTQPSPPRPAGAPSFGAGEQISGSGRFRIVQFIAQGGMGEVYEAEDTELHETVALKTVRPDIAASPHAMERFKREIQLARKITHPNICRIYDLFNHTRPDGSQVIFLTMELLTGESLAARLKRTGKMTVAAAFPLAKQMAMGLNAAHRAGIVHRDFKCANVMLVASPEAPGGTRAVITDFGLALSTSGKAVEAIGDSIGSIVGSPAYMAPEQVEGKETSSAVDVYAFGIVLYEMVTGVTPFVGENAMAIAVKRLKELPPSPRRYTPDLDENWERAILQCLEIDPLHRFSSMMELVKAITPSAAPVRPAAPPPVPMTFKPAAPAPAPGAAPTRAMVCPNCYRQLGTMTRCPACNIDVAPQSGPDSDEQFIRSIHKRKATAKRKVITGRMIGVMIPLLLIAAFLGALCWPVPPPPTGQPLGPASRALIKAGWDQFQDDVKFHRIAHYEIADGQLTSLIQERPEGAGTVVNLQDGLKLYVPTQWHGLPIKLRITAFPVYEKQHLKLNLDDVSFGVIPVPAVLMDRVEEKLDEDLTPQLQTILKGVTTAKFAKGKVTLDYIPPMTAPGQMGGEGWRVIK
jgi:tRNA A-37 threonylcarbamoyl transferase component Bud32